MKMKFSVSVLILVFASLSYGANTDAVKEQLRKLDMNLIRIANQNSRLAGDKDINSMVSTAKGISQNIHSLLGEIEAPKNVVDADVRGNDNKPGALSGYQVFLVGLIAALGGALASVMGLTALKKKFWSRDIKSIRITHDLVLKSLPQPVICLYKGRALYINPAAEACGLNKENFSEVLMNSTLENGARTITLGEEKFYLDEEVVDSENNVILMSARPYRTEISPLENIIGLKELEKSVATKSLLMTGSTNIKSEFFVSLERSSYLFQIAGKIITLNVSESPLSSCIEPEKLNKVFNSYFDTLYRLIKDDDSERVHLSLNSDEKCLKVSAYIENGQQAHQKIERGQGEILKKMTSIKGELYGFAPQINIHKFKENNAFEILLSFDLADKWEQYFEERNTVSM